MRFIKMQKLINDAMNSYTTDEDVIRMTKPCGKVKIIQYNMLKNVKNIDNLFKGGIVGLIILYPSEPQAGHWTLLRIIHCNDGSNENTLEFFDPIALSLDVQLKFEYKCKKDGDCEIPWLSKLISESQYTKVLYNTFPLQNSKYTTCGRWVALRLRFGNYSLREFANLFRKEKDSDWYCAALTLLL